MARCRNTEHEKPSTNSGRQSPALGAVVSQFDTAPSLVRPTRASIYYSAFGLTLCREVQFVRLFHHQRKRLHRQCNHLRHARNLVRLPK
jgi:hypothetical protein